MSPHQRHISEWEEWCNTLFTQVLKGWISAIFLLGTVELKDVPVVQLERTSGWLGQENQCCTVPLWLQDTGSAASGTVIYPGALKRQHGNLSVFNRCFWRPQSRLSDPEIAWMKDLWLSKLFGSCVFWEPSVHSWSAESSYSVFSFFSQQYWWAVWAGACLSLSFLATSVSFVRWRENSISMLGLSSDKMNYFMKVL